MKKGKRKTARRKKRAVDSVPLSLRRLTMKVDRLLDENQMLMAMVRSMWKRTPLPDPVGEVFPPLSPELTGVRERDLSGQTTVSP